MYFLIRLIKLRQQVGHNFIIFYQKKKQMSDSIKSLYVPKLHSEMPDWKKVLYYNEHVTKQFPGLDGSFPDMTSPEYMKEAIDYVDALLEEKEKKYKQRLEKREKSEKKKEEERKKKEEAHVCDMKKKYGRGWEEDVKGTAEDCRTAWLIREENERKDELDYYRQEQELFDLRDKYKYWVQEEDHRELFFRVRMDLETREMQCGERELHILIEKRKQVLNEWNRINEEDASLEAENDEWIRAFENDTRKKEEKKKRVEKYILETKKKF